MKLSTQRPYLVLVLVVIADWLIDQVLGIMLAVLLVYFVHGGRSP